MEVDGRVLVVTPTLNEIESIGHHIEDVFGAVPDISVLVADDGSTDGTSETVERLCERFPNLHLLRRPDPPSFAGSYRDGLLWGVEKGYKLLISMDADRSHPASALPALIRGAEKADLVIASRYLYGVSVMNWPLRRVLLSAFANRYARLLTTVPSTDLTSGFCGYRAELVRSLPLDTLFSSGYAFQIEMKYRAWLAGARLHEVPYTFVERRRGRSKLNWGRIIEGVVAPLSCRLRLGRPARQIRRRAPTREPLP